MDKRFVLENQALRFVLDDAGIIHELTNKRTGSALVTEGTGMTGWKMISNLGSWREHPIFDTDNHAQVRREGERITLFFDGLKGKQDTQAFRVTLEYALDGDELVAQIQVENQADEVLREIWFPFFSGVHDLDRGVRHQMLLNYSTGILMDDPKENLPHFDGYDFGNRPGGHFYTRGFGKYPLMYPGIASMPWMDYFNAKQGWYLGYHDPKTPSVSMLMRVRDQEGDMQLGFARYPMIQPGQTWKSGQFIIRCHEEDWHAGARRYASFAKGKIGVTIAPDWLQNAPGFHLISCIGQDRRINNDYDHIYGTFVSDRAAGLDLPILVFGWVRRGFDNGYPELDPDDRVGGAPKLREVIAKVQSEGGHVMLYTQGRLIDLCTDYYKEIGKDCCLKSEDGTPYIDEYSFNTESTLYPNRLFALGCPSTQQWENQLKKQIDIVMDLGADGLLYDQIGADLSYICFDDSHGHEAPDMAFDGKIQMLENLQQYAAAKNPDFAIIGELICDAFLQKLDITHGWETQDGPDTPSYLHTLSEIYRYTWPEHRPSSRMAGDRVGYNRAFVNGLVLEHAHRRPGREDVVDYVAQLQCLRGQLMDFFNHSRFVDEDGLICQPEGMMAKRYLGKGKNGVALANQTDRLAQARITLQDAQDQATLYTLDGRQRQIEIDGGVLQIELPAETAVFVLYEAK